jgi:hypothetical protein
VATATISGDFSMRQHFAFAAAVLTISFSVLLVPGATAMTVGTAAGIKQGFAETSAVEKVVRVCRHRFFTSKRECYVDRSRPPTVCHRIRGTNRMDCY